ncbi:MAG: 2-hydroxyacyl-CoA dehydratase, partial [Dehalococcoidia bacterium]|nr:2-hydroxyacyl-CoA dehydratase [Dehalococcoidia bacterium]
LEMLTALDLVPYRIYGSIKEPITDADRALPTSFCPFIRSCIDRSLKGKDDFVDGLVTAHSCDPQHRTAHVWESYVKYSYTHFIDMPGTVRADSLEYFKGQLGDFKKTLEAFTGKKLSPDKLKAAIESHNQQRALVKELYQLTKPSPPLVSGAEILQVIKALMSLPVTEGNELLTQVIKEVKSRQDGPAKKPARLLVWSSTSDDVDIMQIFESEANVVMDDSCGGFRPFRAELKLTDDPIDGLADYYLNEITCARTFRQATLGETKKDYARDLQSRFGYFKGIVKDWKINGAILFLVRYCDPFAFEMPAFKDYLEGISVPSIYIEYDYTIGALAPIRTRVEAFLETIS